MKNKILFLLPILCLFLSSCFEMEETYNLKADGSYFVNYDMNMDGIVSMISAMIPDSADSSRGLKAERDTLVNLGAMPDSLIKKINPRELALMKKTDMRIQMKMKDGIFRVGFTNEGKSLDELKYFLSNFSKVMQRNKVGDIIGAPLGADKSTNIPQDEEMPFNNAAYDYTITNTVFERKIKPEIFAARKSKDEMAYKMIESMNLKITSTIVVNLPKPAVNVDNPKAILSADKMQFKLVVNMIDAIKEPTLLNFKVTY